MLSPLGRGDRKAVRQSVNGLVRTGGRTPDAIHLRPQTPSVPLQLLETFRNLVR